MGPRAHRRLRGPVARPPPRRHGAAARPSSRTCTTPSRRPRAVRGEIEALRAGSRRSRTWSRCARARPAIAERDGIGRRRPVRDGAQARAAALRDDAPDAGHRGAAPGRRAALRPRASRALTEWLQHPGRPVRDRAPAQTASPTTTSAPATARERAALPDRAAARSATPAGCTSARAAAMSGASGGRTRAGRGSRSTTSPIIRRIATGPGRAPACHVSWFEADAFARAHDARLPTEQEWEKAATWDQAATRRGGALAGVGQVWEWTASQLRRLSRLRGLPLPRVLRGVLRRRATGCCAAARGRRDPRVASATFRNWDLPLRRQIFSGPAAGAGGRDGAGRCRPAPRGR